MTEKSENGANGFDGAGRGRGGRRRMPKKKRRTYLHVDTRTKNWIWVRYDEMRPGHRRVRSTKTKDHTQAIEKASQFEREYQEELAGLTRFDGWKRPILPVALAWIASIKIAPEDEDPSSDEAGGVRKKTRDHLRRWIERAIEKLGLRTLSDLRDPELASRLEKLKKSEKNPAGFTSKALRRTFQDPLKRLARWIASPPHKLVDQNALADWLPIKVGKSKVVRRAPSITEVARAMLAARAIDEARNRAFPERPAFLSLLIGGARSTAMVTRDVEHLLVTAVTDKAGRVVRREGRIELPPGHGKKRNGECALDAQTLDEIIAFVGERKDGPLFLSPAGARLNGLNLLDDWRECFGLSVVDEIWPEGEPKSWNRVYNVARSLHTGETCIGSRGGNPKKMRPETLKAQAQEEADVSRIVGLVRAEWERRMEKIDVHAFRMTHESWSYAKEVHPLLIEKQVGHRVGGGDGMLGAVRDAVESEISRRHYIDFDFDGFDARVSAEAVRASLDEGTTLIRGTCLIRSDAAREYVRSMFREHGWTTSEAEPGTLVRLDGSNAIDTRVLGPEPIRQAAVAALLADGWEKAAGEPWKVVKKGQEPKILERLDLDTLTPVCNGGEGEQAGTVAARAV